MSFRSRLTLFGAGLVAATVLAFGWLVYQLAAHTQASDQDRVLTTRVAEAAAALQDAPSDQFSGGMSLTAAENLRTHTDVFVEIFDSSATPLSSSARIGSQAPTVPVERLRQATHTTVLTTIDASGIRLRIAIRRWTRADLGLAGFAVVGQPISVQASNLTGLRWFLIISAIPALLAALGASWLVTGRALKPLRTVVETTQAIARTRDLERRLPHSNSRDELGQLSQSFNLMLSEVQQAQRQLAAALEAQRRFVADASHELRTPLTTIRGNAGLLAFGPNVGDDVRSAAARDIATEAERMSRLVERLLTLAQADAGQRLELAPVALRPIVESVGRQAQLVHPDRNIGTSAPTRAAPATGGGTDELRVNGDEDALTQLLWILIDNAIKFTADGGTIDIELGEDANHVRLTVTDDGIGIPPADLERVFERFYQADASRSGTGAGLGLSIARWIVAQHAGTITARNHDGPGCTFTVLLPRQA